MLKINKKIEYALMALKFMYEKENQKELTSAREVCEKFHTPFDTTAKVMQIMNIHNILTSVKGVKGGYILSKDLGQVSLLSISKMIEGSHSNLACQGSAKTCNLAENCNIMTPLDLLNKKILSYLNDLSLQELFDYKKNEEQCCE